MAHVTLLPARIHPDGRISPGAEPITLEWADLVARFIPPDTEDRRSLLRVLAGLKTGMLLGRYRGPEVVRGHDRSRLFSLRVTRGRDLSWLLKDMPDFPERVEEVYRVEEVALDRRLEEGHHDPG